MRIQAGDLQLNYETYGDSGDWLILCHGLGSGLQSMRASADAFADRYRVLIWDNRGIGDSDVAPEGTGYAIEEHADDLAHLMEALSIESAIVQGVSWGGVVVQRFAIKYPEKVRALIVDSSSAEVNERAAQNWVARGEAVLRDGPEAVQDAPAGLTEAGTRAAVATNRRATAPVKLDRHAYLETCKAIASLNEHPMTEELRKITAPTLVIVGADDQVAGVGGSVKMSRVIPDATLVIVPDTGHGVCALNPEAFRRELEALVGRIS
jgi:3-oxoadipate enol-lactonase